MPKTLQSHLFFLQVKLENTVGSTPLGREIASP